jgi:hypothetical protein
VFSYFEQSVEEVHLKNLGAKSPFLIESFGFFGWLLHATEGS